MRVLIDTCIVIDALQSREPFCADAQKIFLAVANHRIEGFLTAKSSADIYYITHRQTHSDKEARRILNTLFNLFALLDTTGLDCRRAISSELSDFEDAIMAESAIRAEMDCIVTRNLIDYKKSAIPICSPADLLHHLETDDVEKTVIGSEPEHDEISQ